MLVLFRGCVDLVSENPVSIRSRSASLCQNETRKVVGETGFEPATSGTQNQRSTKLSYSPTLGGRVLYELDFLYASIEWCFFNFFCGG